MARRGRGAERSPWLRRIVAAAAVLAIVASGAYVVYAFLVPGPDPFELAYYVCDECGTYFAAARALPPVACPKCHKKAGVLVSWLRCEQCGHCYEGLHYRPVAGREAEFFPKSPAALPMQEIKWGDSGWVSPGSERGMRLVRKLHACPKCESARVNACDPPAGLDQAKPEGATPAPKGT